MALIDIRFGTQSYPHDSSSISSERLINAFSERQPPDAKYPSAIFGVAGVTTFVTAGTGPVRGLFYMNDLVYTVSGTTVYAFDSAANITTVGDGIGGNGVVSIDGDGTNVVIVNGVDGCNYNSSTAVCSPIVDPNFFPANTVTFIDDRFAFDRKGTREVFISNLLDGTTYPALGFATKESRPDRVVATRNRQNTLLVFGEQTIEIWYDQATVPFPFAPYAGALLNRGLMAAHATAEEDNALFFLGDDLIFYRLSGMAMTRVSTHALERLWATYPTATDAFAFAINDRGHKFINLTFPTAKATFGYDIATSLWHERISDDDRGSQLRWRAQGAISAFGKHFVGDVNSGKIGFIDPAATTEFGDPIIMTVISPPIHGHGKRLFMSLFELDIEGGVGNAVDPGSDPQIVMDYSDDGGKTWSSPQRFAGMGKLGEYGTRVYWDQLGTFYSRTIRVSISESVVRRTILAARADITSATGR